MDNCDMTKLIELIRTRPAVWDVKSNDYSIKIKKKECWTEILRNMMVDFDDLPEYMKEYKSR